VKRIAGGGGKQAVHRENRIAGQYPVAQIPRTGEQQGNRQAINPSANAPARPVNRQQQNRHRQQRGVFGRD